MTRHHVTEWLTSCVHIQRMRSCLLSRLSASQAAQAHRLVTRNARAEHAGLQASAWVCHRWAILECCEWSSPVARVAPPKPSLPPPSHYLLRMKLSCRPPIIPNSIWRADMQLQKMSCHSNHVLHAASASLSMPQHMLKDALKQLYGMPCCHWIH